MFCQKRQRLIAWNTAGPNEMTVASPHGSAGWACGVTGARQRLGCVRDLDWCLTLGTTRQPRPPAARTSFGLNQVNKRVKPRASPDAFTTRASLRLGYFKGGRDSRPTSGVRTLHDRNEHNCNEIARGRLRPPPGRAAKLEATWGASHASQSLRLVWSHARPPTAE